MTAQDIIEAACNEIGFLRIGQSLAADYSTWGLGKLNRLLKTLAADGIMIPVRVHENFPLVSGTAGYTIKTGGDFDTTSPKVIEDAFIRINSQDYPVKVRPIREYWSLSNKTNSDRPGSLYYTDETIYFYCTPNSSYDFHLVSQKPFTVCVAGVEVDLPGEYENMLVLNLAVSFALPLEKKISSSLALDAKIALDSVKAKNLADQMKRTEINI